MSVWFFMTISTLKREKKSSAWHEKYTLDSLIPNQNLSKNTSFIQKQSGWIYQIISESWPVLNKMESKVVNGQNIFKCFFITLFFLCLSLTWCNVLKQTINLNWSLSSSFLLMTFNPSFLVLFFMKPITTVFFFVSSSLLDLPLLLVHSHKLGVFKKKNNNIDSNLHQQGYLCILQEHMWDIFILPLVLYSGDNRSYHENLVSDHTWFIACLLGRGQNICSLCF